MDPDQEAILKLFRFDDNSDDGGEGNAIIFGVALKPVTRFGIGGSGGPEAGSPPDLGYATSNFIPRGRPFSSFVKSHRRAAKDLSDYFMKAKNPRELVELAQKVRRHVNETLFVYSLSFCILRNPAMRRLRCPTVVEVFPDKFTGQERLMKAKAEIKRMEPDQREVVIDQEFSGTLLKAEHRVSYWREDYGINAHHWHWHLVYPVELNIVRDRKGELFYYMHQQMLARYDMERLSVGLNRVLPFNNLRIAIEDGYFSKLTVNNAGRAWGTRQDNTLLKDVRRDDFGLGFIEISELETWYGRILDAVHQGYMIDRQGNHCVISDDILTNGKRGIDILGDAFEADAEISVNYPFYGDFHNFGHIVIAFAHDPDFAHKEEMGVMGDSTTAMRDPVFYRWHKFIDSLFQDYKRQQRPYTLDELNLTGIKIERASVKQGNNVNNLHTGWNTRMFEAGRGLDFNSEVPVNLKFTHLDHKPFEYHLQVTNNRSSSKDVTVRIFLAPTGDERGNTMSFNDQRVLWAEMDKFTVTLNEGLNQIVRSSKESSITSPEELTFKDLEAGILYTPGTEEASEFGICGCGWPQHMLLPRGTPQGMDFQLFFMLTDYDVDKVEQPSPSNRVCTNAASFCGILDGKYPDSRPMGFPFDRTNPEKINDKVILTAEDFAGQLENTIIQDIKITFSDALME